MVKVSVIMGVYNCKDKKMLKKSIDSIINQTYSNWEYIICNDGSTDNTLEELNKIVQVDSRIKVISYDKNKGLNYALNNASNTGENLQSSESKITDADMAKSILEYSKNSILEQAVQAMLSQTKSGVETVKNLLTT